MNTPFAGGRFSARSVSGAVTLILAAVATTQARQAGFQLMGIPPNNVQSLAVGVSADGAVVAGFGISFNGTQNVAFVWTEAAGLQPLPLPDGAAQTQDNAISGDGRTVLGTAYGTFGSRACIWPPAGPPQYLDQLSGGAVLATTAALSYDGSVLVGTASHISPYRAWRWSIDQGLMYLPDLPGGTLGSTASAISADGTVVLGRSSTATDLPAVRWVLDGQPQPVAGATFWGVPASCSADASVITGRFGALYFRVRAQQIQWVPMSERNISADGRIIAGSVTRPNPPPNGPDTDAALWDAVRGARLLQDLLAAQGVSTGGWTPLYALANGDGTVLVGQAQDASGRKQAFIAHLPRFICYPNCDESDVYPALNVNDFACFLNRFAAGDAYANCDGSTTPPVLNIQDFACFIAAFAAGCP